MLGVVKTQASEAVRGAAPLKRRAVRAKAQRRDHVSGQETAQHD